jgi:hypothetical protein
MKATLNGTSTIYWVASNTPDFTGSQSGYNVANLSNIAIDYSTTSNTTNTGGTVNPSAVGVRIAPDIYDAMVWTFDENTAPFSNYGNGGSNNFINGGSGYRAGRAGLFGNGLDLPGGNSAYVKDTNSYIPNSSFTVSGWVYLKSYSTAGNACHLIYKLHNPIGNWSGSGGYVDIEITLSGSAADGTGIFGINKSGLSSISFSTADKIPINAWTHLGLTWDGTTLNAYINGNLIGTSTNGAGTVNWGSGNWILGVNPSSTSENSPFAIIDDLRIANIARPQSYFQQVYQAGVGLSSNLTQITAGTINTSDGYANLPTAGIAGKLFFPTDSSTIQRDNGTSWQSWGPIYQISKPPQFTGTNFTWLNQGSATLSNTTAGTLITAPGTSAQPAQGIYQPGIISSSMFVQAASYWTCTGVTGGGAENTSINLWSGVLMVESSTGKYLGFQLGTNQFTGIQHPEWELYYGSGTTTTLYSFGYMYSSLSNGLTFVRLRLSASNILAEVSVDQQNWTQLASIPKTTAFTSAPDNVGLVVTAPNISGVTANFTFYHYKQG